MERDKGIEPSPRPWQGRVLPLYESRSDNRIYSMERRRAARRERSKCCETAAGSAEMRYEAPGLSRRGVCPGQQTPRASIERSVDFANARRLHDGRSPLPVGKMLCALAVDVHAREFLAVVVIDGHLPVAMLAALVAIQTLLYSSHVILPQDFGCHTIAVSARGRKQ